MPNCNRRDHISPWFQQPFANIQWLNSMDSPNLPETGDSADKDHTPDAAKFMAGPDINTVPVLKQSHRELLARMNNARDRGAIARGKFVTWTTLSINAKEKLRREVFGQYSWPYKAIAAGSPSKIVGSVNRHYLDFLPLYQPNDRL